MYAIEAVNLTCRFGESVAVDALTMQVRAGEIFGFLGLNGAGKTTTIRMLTGQIQPSSGTATIFGRDIRKDRYSLKGIIGVMQEDLAIRSGRSAWEHLMNTAKFRDVRTADAKRRGRDLLGMFGLADRADEPAGTFSKGMKRRLTIAMSLMHFPLLLVLDEPTSGLDVESTLIIREVLRELNRNGVTIFLTTHMLEEADLLCDRVAILNYGKLAACDTPERLKCSIRHESALHLVIEPGGPEIEDVLRGIPQVTGVRREGDRYVLSTDDLPAVLCSIGEFLQRTNRRILSLKTGSPSLEEAFVRYTGIGEPRPRPGMIRWLRPETEADG